MMPTPTEFYVSANGVWLLVTSGAVPVLDAPSAVNDFAAVVVDPTVVNLSWTVPTIAPSPIANYVVEWSSSLTLAVDMNFTQIGTVPFGTNTYSHTSPTQNGAFNSYRVRPTDMVSKVGPWATLTNIISDPPPLILGFTGEFVSDTINRLEWRTPDPLNDAATYEIRYSPTAPPTSTTEGTLVASPAVPTTTVDHTKLVGEGSIDLYYGISPVQSDGAYGSWFPVMIKPIISNPTDFSANWNSTTTNTLTWSEPTSLGNATDYEIRYSSTGSITSNTDGTLLTNPTLGTTTFTHTKLAGEEYTIFFYGIASRNADGEYSTFTQATLLLPPPVAPTNLVGTFVSDAVNTFTWIDSTDLLAVKYDLCFNTIGVPADDTDSSVIKNVAPLVQAATHNKTSPATTASVVYYGLAARNVQNTPSDWVQTSVTRYIPVLASIVEISRSQTQVIWECRDETGAPLQVSNLTFYSQRAIEGALSTSSKDTDSAGRVTLTSTFGSAYCYRLSKMNSLGVEIYGPWAGIGTEIRSGSTRVMVGHSSTVEDGTRLYRYSFDVDSWSWGVNTIAGPGRTGLYVTTQPPIQTPLTPASGTWSGTPASATYFSEALPITASVFCHQFNSAPVDGQTVPNSTCYGDTKSGDVYIPNRNAWVFGKQTADGVGWPPLSGLDTNNLEVCPGWVNMTWTP
jgi:hypothetical protein